MPVRVRGLLFVLLGVGLFGAGLAVAALWRNTPPMVLAGTVIAMGGVLRHRDRKSTRLNSSH